MHDAPSTEAAAGGGEEAAIRQDLDALIRLTEAMRRAATGGDWEAMPVLDAQRLALLQGLPRPMPAWSAGILTALAGANQELEALARDARDQVGVDLRRLRGARAYVETGK